MLDKASRQSGVRLKRTVGWRLVGDQAVIVDVERGVYFVLEDSEVELWERLMEGDSFEEVVSSMEKNYDQPVSVIAEDLRSFVRDLRDEGLIEAETAFEVTSSER